MKTYFNTLILCFLAISCYAQLTVKNNAFIFVDGTTFTNSLNVAPLYVTDDVRIEDTSSIYLRNDAQLLQGSGTTGNSGIGKLSVYQEGTVHNYAYNYWASPVGEISLDNTGNSNFIAGDIFNNATGLITSVPALIGESLDGIDAPLTISKHWLYAFNPGTQYSEWDFLGDGASINAGYGFSMKGSTGSTNQRYDFRGKPNSGDIDVAVLSAQYTLAGNPYPSAINAGAFIHDPTNSSNMMGTLLFWEHDLTVASHVLTEYVGGYASYNIAADGSMENYVPAMFATLGSDGFPNTGAGTASNPAKFIRQYIPIGQGFMIEGSATTTGTVTFRNSHREFYKETGTNSQFFKTNSTSQNQPTTINEIQYNADGFQILEEGKGLRRFRLNVDFNNEITRQLLHNFHPNATSGFDYGLESNNSEPNSRDAYFINGDMPFITQANNYDINLKIPLVIKVDQNLPLRIRIYDVQQFNNEPIYVHDKQTDVYYDLTTMDFNTNLVAGTYADRFEITFTNGSALSVDEFESSNFTIFQNNTISKLVVLNPESLNIKSINLIDVSGKQVFKELNIENQTRYQFPTNKLSDGVYVVTIILKNNNTVSKKLVVTNK